MEWTNLQLAEKKNISECNLKAAWALKKGYVFQRMLAWFICSVHAKHFGGYARKLWNSILLVGRQSFRATCQFSLSLSAISAVECPQAEKSVMTLSFFSKTVHLQLLILSKSPSKRMCSSVKIRHMSILLCSGLHEHKGDRHHQRPPTLPLCFACHPSSTATHLQLSLEIEILKLLWKQRRSSQGSRSGHKTTLQI